MRFVFRRKPQTGLLLLVILAVVVLQLFSQGSLQVGYGVLTSDGGTMPVATALFSFRNSSGVLVAEAGVAAVQPIRAGRILVDESGPRTGIALANTSGQSVDLTLTLNDSNGNFFDDMPLNLAAGAHLPKFADELFSNLPEGFLGSLTFRVTQNNLKVAAVTLRQSINSHGEALLATLPVADLDGAQGEGDFIVFPHIGAGGVLSTQIALINPGDGIIRGTIGLVGSDGNPLQLELDGVPGSEFSFELASNGVFRGELTLASNVAKAGYAVVEVDQGVLPAGTAIFQFRDLEGSLVSEAGVGAIAATTRARIFVDNASTQTGVAIASVGNAATEVTFELLDRNGVFIDRTKQNLSAQGHTAIFADQLFPELPDGFTGLMEISCSVPVIPITLKLSQNSRAELILTTLPVADLNRPLNVTSLVFPQIGLGFFPGFGTFATRLIVIQTDTGSGASGKLSFLQSSGAPMEVPMSGEVGSQFDYDVPGGGARQFYPGVTAELSTIVMQDPNAVVNEGETFPLRPILLDTEGNSRDDFPLQFVSLDQTKVTVNELGQLFGVSRGFATVTVSSQGIVVSVNVAVATITSGTQGLEVNGVVQDFGEQIYLSSGSSHTILKALDLSGTAQIYAGKTENSGLVNGLRLASEFNEPSFIALDQSQGKLYVSDSANHAIRLVEPGDGGQVKTLTGTGAAGSQDGALASASFRNPQGIAIDRDGQIWVVDSGNQTIRRINTVTGVVETLAGTAGAAGSNDGVGSQARFNAPQGITYETEPLSEQLQREVTGDPPPPVSMIVADTGNNILRRVWEDGTVETIGGSTLTASVREKQKRSRSRMQVTPFQFTDPTGVLVDSFGNFYISETFKGRVKILLRNGQVWQAVQPGTFDNPRGMALTKKGRVVVAETRRAVQEIRYAGPSLAEIRPLRVDNRGGTRVDILGSNFAPDTLVIVGGVPILDAQVVSNRRITFIAPPLPSGRLVVSLQHRGGADQGQILVDPVPLADLDAGDITTVVGGSFFAGDGLAATRTNLLSPAGGVFDVSGNFYVADREANRVRKVDAVTGIATTVAGTGEPGWTGDGGPAVSGLLNAPEGLALDQDGSLLIVDSGNHVVRKVSPGGIITTIAGNGKSGFSGDGGLAVNASLSRPCGVAVSPGGDIFVSDSYNYRLRTIDGETGRISTFAGNGEPGWSGDGGAARFASLSLPCGLGFDSEGNLFVADSGNHVIRRIAAGSSTITTVAGSGKPGFWGDGGPAVEAGLNFPLALAVDSSGNLFIGDLFNARVRRVSGGRIATAAGNGLPSFSGDGGGAVFAGLNLPGWVALDGADDLYISDAGNRRVRRVRSRTGIIETVVGDGDLPDTGDGSLSSEAVLGAPAGLDFDRAGSLLIADAGSHRIRKVSPLPGANYLLAGGIARTIAGTGQPGFSVDGELAVNAALNHPTDVVVEPEGSVLEVDTGTHRIRRIYPSQSGLLSFFGFAGTADPGTIVTVTGNGEPAFAGDQKPAKDAYVHSPRGAAVDEFGNICFADTGNHRVRCISAANGIIYTVAGNGEAGYSGDGVVATQTSLHFPAAVAFDSVGNLYIADTGNHRVRVVFDGIIETVAGIGQGGYSGDGGAAEKAKLNFPVDIVFSETDDLFIADRANHRVRRMDGKTRVITTVVGTGEAGFGGDGGPARQASLNGVRSIAFDSLGNLFVSDYFNRRIRAVKGPIP